jgi:hypothetical protein
MLASRQPPLATNPYDPICVCGHPLSEHAAGYDCLCCDCDSFDSDGGEDGWGWAGL